jgi:Cu/Ag efflux protein CusF
MHSLKILVVAIAAAATPFAYGQAQSPSGAAVVGTAPGKGVAMQHVKATAMVEAVDASKRTVTLKNARGEVRTITAGPEVRNFDQIKVGDSVTIEYVEGLALELKKDGKAVLGRSEVKSLERSDPGKKPGGMATREITAVADVVNVDSKKSTVTVKNKEGETFDLNIRDPEQLKLIKKGDQIQATYTEAVAVSLKPAPAAAPKKK